ncbi:MAG: hypothetical protein ACO306_02850 [Flavobacteriaceae bacterium]
MYRFSLFLLFCFNLLAQQASVPRASGVEALGQSESHIVPFSSSSEKWTIYFEALEQVEFEETNHPENHPMDDFFTRFSFLSNLRSGTARIHSDNIASIHLSKYPIYILYDHLLI